MGAGEQEKHGDEWPPNCVVCIETLGRYGGPASLPCGHNGCLECLQKVQSHSAVPTCPLCRTQFDPEMNLGINLELKEAIQYTGRKINSSRNHQGQQPEVNLANVVSGMFNMVRGAARSKKINTSGTPENQGETSRNREEPWGEEEDLWGSVLFPSAPPLSSVAATEDIRAKKAILEAEPPEWLPDSRAYSCMKCSANFRPFVCGRHHCRFCGGIFCRRCSRGRCLLPAKFREREPQRVCDACYDRLEPVQRLLVESVSSASQLATHDVTDYSCMRSWLNTPYGFSMEQEIYKATNALRSYAKMGPTIPEAVLRGAKGVAILTVAKVGVVVTYKVGTGLVIARRTDGSWSAPTAIACAGLGWGAQMGGEITDFIIILRNVEALYAFSGRVHFSLGTEVSVAAGPIGGIAEADVRAGDGGATACYSYSLSKGVFVGVSLEGSVVMRRSDTNVRFYGDSYLTSEDIMSESYPPPRAAIPLYEALENLFNCS